MQLNCKDFSTHSLKSSKILLGRIIRTLKLNKFKILENRISYHENVLLLKVFDINDLFYEPFL